MRLSHRAVWAVVIFAMSAVAAFGVSARAEDAPRPVIHAVDVPGTYKSRNERCGAELKPADIGEYRVLAITRDGSVVQSVNGATALLWLNDNRLIYSTSAIMGDGGFWHNGLTSGVANAVFNRDDGILIVMKNGYTSATGTQDVISKPSDRTIENTLQGLGVGWMKTVNNYHVDALMKAGGSREELADTLAMALQMGGGPALMYAGHALACWDELASPPAE